jgi:hypothetical protein
VRKIRGGANYASEYSTSESELLRFLSASPEVQPSALTSDRTVLPQSRNTYTVLTLVTSITHSQITVEVSYNGVNNAHPSTCAWMLISPLFTKVKCKGNVHSRTGHEGPVGE